jgi:hypothetical protein
MAKKKSGEDMYGKKIVGPKGHVRHGKTTHKRKKSSDITLEKNNDKKIKGYIGPRDSNKAHPTGMQAYSGARRNKLKKALDAREDKVRPSKKKVPKTIPTIKARSAPTKRRPTMKEQLKDSSVAIDYDQLDKMQGGGKVMKKNMGGSLKAPNNPGLAKLPTPVRNEMGYAKAGGEVKGYKKGGSITYRMSGGQVVGHGYD